MIEPRQDVSFADFVAWERDQAELHELIAGRIVRFLAGSADDEIITVNVLAKLHASVAPPCIVFPSTTIVQTASRIGRDGYRPDVTVACSKANVGRREFIEEPRVVVEILSPSNYGHDWNAKLFEYWNTASIEQLVLIDAQARHVTSNVRDADGTWLPPLIHRNDGVLDFTPLAVSMTFEKIYANTSLAAERR